MKTTPALQALEARVVTAERGARPSSLYNGLRVVTTLLSLATYVIIAILIPTLRLRHFLQSTPAGLASLLGGNLLVVTWAAWCTDLAVRFWLYLRLQLARRFQGGALVESASPEASSPVFLPTDDIASTLARLPLLRGVLGPIHALRQREESIERELDQRIKSLGRQSMQTRRTLLRMLLSFGVGLAVFVGLFLGMYFYSQVPNHSLRGLGDAERLVLGGIVALCTAAPIGYSTYHSLRFIRRTVSLGMIESLKPKTAQWMKNLR